MVQPLLVFVLLMAWTGSRAGAQTASPANQATSAGPDYDVATVKGNNTGGGSGQINISDDVLQATNIPLQSLLEIAFDIHRDQIVGLPHCAGGPLRHGGEGC
jgi:hypothetical protein